jgi:hypothetical protein
LTLSRELLRSDERGELGVAEGQSTPGGHRNGESRKRNRRELRHETLALGPRGGKGERELLDTWVVADPSAEQLSYSTALIREQVTQLQDSLEPPPADEPRPSTALLLIGSRALARPRWLQRRPRGTERRDPCTVAGSVGEKVSNRDGAHVAQDKCRYTTALARGKHPAWRDGAARRSVDTYLEDD